MNRATGPIPFANYWLQDAKDGDDHSATLLLQHLAEGVRHESLNFALRDFLATALAAMATAYPGHQRVAVTKERLLLGRRPGRTSKFRARQIRFELASAVWDQVGDATGNELRNGLKAVAARRPGTSLRLLKAAYDEYKPAFVEQRNAACNWGD